MILSVCVKIPVFACLLLEYQSYCCLVGHPLTAAAATAKNKQTKKNPKKRLGVREGHFLLDAWFC